MMIDLRNISDETEEEIYHLADKLEQKICSYIMYKVFEAEKKSEVVKDIDYLKYLLYALRAYRRERNETKLDWANKTTDTRYLED